MKEFIDSIADAYGNLWDNLLWITSETWEIVSGLFAMIVILITSPIWVIPYRIWRANNCLKRDGGDSADLSELSTPEGDPRPQGDPIPPAAA